MSSCRRQRALIAFAVVVAVAAQSLSARDPSLVTGGTGGAPSPTPPPPFAPQPITQPNDPPVDFVRGGPPVLLAVSGEDVARRMALLRRMNGVIVSYTFTDEQGIAVLPAPTGEPLFLDVVGTEAVAIPVLAGQSVRVVLVDD